MERYEEHINIGQGTYGIVSQALDTYTGLLVALKKIPLDNQEEGIPSTAIREISQLKMLSHENIVQLFDVFHNQNQIVLVFELLEKDLKRYLETNGGARVKGLDVTVLESLMIQLLKGLAYCHQLGIMHRDLKPQNLLLNAEGQLKIADFGLARSVGIPVRSYTSEVVTLWYRPVDILLGQTKYSLSVDLWSVGCIFAEMFTGIALFQGKNDESQLEAIFSKLGVPTEQTLPGLEKLPNWNHKYNTVKLTQPRIQRILEGLSGDGQDLLLQFLEYNPAKRISASQALKHPYFAGFQ